MLAAGCQKKIAREIVEADHGRIETRRHWITEQIVWFADATQRKSLRSFGIGNSIRAINRQRSYERRLLADWHCDFLAAIIGAT